MSISVNLRSVFMAGAAGLLAMSVPAIAQTQDMSDQHMPMCSSTVTDHCMQREGHGATHASAHHHARHTAHAKRHHHRHHKTHVVKKQAAATPAKH